MATIKDKATDTVSKLYNNIKEKDDAIMKEAGEKLSDRKERVEERRSRIEQQRKAEAERASQLSQADKDREQEELLAVASTNSIQGGIARNIVRANYKDRVETQEANEKFVEADIEKVRRQKDYIDSQRPSDYVEVSTDDLTKQANELALEKGYDRDFSTLTEKEKQAATRWIDPVTQPASYDQALDQALRSKAQSYIQHPNMTIFSQSISNGFRMGLEKGWAKLTTQSNAMLETRLKRGVRGAIDKETKAPSVLTNMPRGINAQELEEIHKSDFDMQEARTVAYNTASNLAEDVLQSSRDIMEDAKVKYMEMEEENNKSIESMDKGYMKMGAHLATGLAEMTTDYSSHIRDAVVGLATTGAVQAINTGAATIKGSKGFIPAVKKLATKVLNPTSMTGEVVQEGAEFIGKKGAKALEYLAFGISSIDENRSNVELIQERETTLREDIEVGVTSLLFKGVMDIGAWGVNRAIGYFNPASGKNIADIGTQPNKPLEQGDVLQYMTKVDNSGMPYNTLSAQGYADSVLSLTDIDSPIKLDISYRDVGRISINTQEGKLAQELKEFRRSNIAPQNYEPALDPRNIRTSIVDGLGDNAYANPNSPQVYLNNGQGQPKPYNSSHNENILLAKNDLDAGLINEVQYEKVVRSESKKVRESMESQVFKDETVGEVLIPAREIPIEKVTSEVTEEVAEGVNPHVAKIIQEENQSSKTATTRLVNPNQIEANDFQQVLEKTADPKTLRGTISKVTDDNNTHFMYKSNEEATTIITINKDNYKSRVVDPKSVSFKENQIQYILNGASIKNYDIPNNRIIEVQGMKKVDYYMGMVSTEAMDRFTRPMQLTANALQAEKNSKNINISSRARDIRVNLAVGQTVTDIAQSEWDAKIANKTSILMGIDSIFNDGLGKYYATIGDAMDEIATPTTLARLYVDGGKLYDGALPTTLVNSTSNVDGKVNGHQAYITRLVETNDFLTSLKRKSNYIETADDDIIASKLASELPKIFEVSDSGALVFSDKPDSLMGSGNGNDLILDMFLNPNKVGIGGETAETVGKMSLLNDYGIKSMDDIDTILSYYNRDDINGLALSKVFSDDKQLKVLRDYGIAGTGIEGTPTTNTVDYLYGISALLLDFNDPNFEGDKQVLRGVLDGFKDTTKMPKRTIIEVGKGTTEVDMSLSDFILYKPETGVTMKDINGVFSDTMLEYGASMEKQIVGLIEKRKDALYRRIDINTKARDEAVQVVDKMIRGFQRYNSPNDYMNSKHFIGLQERLIELGGELNQDLSNLVKMDIIGALKGKTYEGKITTKAPVVKTFKDTQLALEKSLPEIKKAVHSISNLNERMKGTDLKKFVTSNKFSNHVNRLVENADKIPGIDKEALKILAEYNNKNYTQADRTMIQGLVERINNSMDGIEVKTQEAYKTLGKLHSQLDKTNNPKTTIKSKEFTENYTKAKQYLNMGNQLDADGNPYKIDDIDSFLGYAVSSLDDGIDVNDIIFKLRNQKVDLEDYLGDLPKQRIDEINEGFDGMYRTLEDFQKRLMANVDKPVNFYKNADLDGVRNTLIDLNIKAGRPFDEDELLNMDLLKTMKNVVDNVVESKKNNPLNNFRQKDFTKYSKTSTKSDLTISRMAQVIDIEQWHRDRAMFKSGSFASTDVQAKTGYLNKIADLENLNLDELELTNLPKDIFENFVADDMKEKMTVLYNHSKELFKPVVYEVDELGNAVVEKVMDLDQFTLVYYQFLKDLSSSRSVSNAISKAKGVNEKHIADLLPYFNNIDDMKSFFLNSVEGRENYVKSNAQVLDNIRGITADTMADLVTWGRSQASWGYTLVNSKGKNMSLALDRTKEVLSNGTKDLFSEVDEMAARVMKDVGQKLINASLPNSDSFTEKTLQGIDATKVINSIVDMAKLPVMWGVGATEYVFKDMHVYNRIHSRDVWGKSTAGSAWKGAVGNIKRALKGVYSGVADAPAVLTDLSTSAIRGILAVDRAVGVEAAITKLTGKEFNWTPGSVLNGASSNRIIKRGAKQSGDMGELIAQAQRAYNTSRYLDDEAKSFGKTKISKMMDTLKAESNTLQNIAAQKSFVLSYVETADALNNVLKGGFYDMSGENQTRFRRAGITDKNWNKFKEFVRVEAKDAQGNFKYDILSLNGYKSDDWDNNVYADGLKATATSLFNLGYEENRHSKFEKQSGVSKTLNNIYGAFRGTTAGVAQDDLTRIFFSMDERGVWRNKFTGKWNRDAGEMMSQYGNMLIGAGSIAGGLIITGQFSPLINAIYKRHQDIGKEVSAIAGDLMTLSRIEDVEDFESAMEFVHEITQMSIKNATSNLSAGVYFSDGNNVIDNAYKIYSNIVRDGALVLNKYQGNNPYYTEDFAKRVFGFDITKNMSQEEFETSTTGMLALNFIQTVGAIAPMAWAKPTMDMLTTDSTVYEMTQREKDERALKQSGGMNGMDRVEAYNKYNQFEDKARFAASDFSYNLNNFNIKDTVEDAKTKTLLVMELLERKNKSDLTSLQGTNYQMASGMNDIQLKNEMITEEDYIKKSTELFETSGIKQQYDSQPMVVKVVMDAILEADVEANAKTKNDTKILMMADVQQGMSMKEIVNKYSDDPTYVTQIVKDKQRVLKKKPRAKSIAKVEDYNKLPAVYRKIHKVLVGNGKNISEQDMVQMYNDGLTVDDLRTLNN